MNQRTTDPDDHMNFLPRLFTRREALVALGIIFCALIRVRLTLWYLPSGDTSTWVLPWLSFIKNNGHWHALATPFGDYFPSYYYLLTIASYLTWLSPLGQIKVISLVFDLVVAVFAYQIVALLESENGRDPSTSITPFVAAVASFSIPSMVANSAVWGQCDSIYLSFELAAVYYIMKKAPVRAVVSVGLAFAFKIQTVFMGPFLLALLLRKRFSWWHLPLVVGVWLATILPIVLLGRSFSSVMDIYTKQVSGEYGIAEGIANPWSWFYHLHLPESLGINVALLLTVATAAFLTYLAYRRQRLDPAWLFFFASTCLVVFPYVMPKMHDRYFSSGVVFLVILACYDLRFLLPAALFECALLLPTVRFLTNEAHRFNHFTTANIDVAIWSSTAGIFLILRQLWRTRQAPSESAALDTSGIEQAPPIDAPA